MKQFRYISYGGPEDYIFLRCHKKDSNRTITLANELIAKEIRVYFDCADSKTEHTPTEISAAIKNAKLCVFVLSDEALDDLDFRNSINFAFTNRIRIICLRLTKNDLGHGMDMQLANVPMYSDERSLLEVIMNDPDKDLFTGEGQKVIEENKTRKYLTIVLLAAVLCLLIAAAVMIRNRISYYSSAEYRLSQLQDTEFLDFTSYHKEDLRYLKDKNIAYISFRNMSLTDLEGIEAINVEEIDISGNPSLSSVDPILFSKTIKKVHISQDMIQYGAILYDKGIEVIIDG